MLQNYNGCVTFCCLFTKVHWANPWSHCLKCSPGQGILTTMLVNIYIHTQWLLPQNTFIEIKMLDQGTVTDYKKPLQTNNKAIGKLQYAYKLTSYKIILAHFQIKYL